MLVNPLLLTVLLVCLIPGAFSPQGMVTSLRLAGAKVRSMSSIQGAGKPKFKLI